MPARKRFTGENPGQALKPFIVRAGFLIPIAGLVVARLLTPDPRGLGTHQQLGLPPCSMRLLFGIPCPSCGMTTSWSYFSRGDFQLSVFTNFAGFLLACLAILMGVLAIASIIKKHPIGQRYIRACLIAFVAIFGIAILQWIGRFAL